MKPSPISIAVFVVSLSLAPVLLAQARASEGQNVGAPIPAASAGEVPRLIKFSGTLLDAQGRPQAGPVGVTFALYAQQNGGAALWLETQNVKPDENGNYTVLLGANSAHGVPAELFVSGEARWLGIQVGQQLEHERILLVSVPYALKAGDAETLGGLPASAFVTTKTTAGADNSGAASPTSPTSTVRTSAQGQSTPNKAQSTPQAVTPCSSVTSDGTATANSIALFTTACNVQSSLMSQATINGFPGVNLAGNNAGLLLSGTGTHQVQVTGAASSGRLGQDATGFFFSSDTSGKVIKFLTNNGTLNEWMRITSAGNVGIGTQTPAVKLDVIAPAGGGIFGQTSASGWFGINGQSMNAGSIGILGQNFGGGGVAGFDTFNIGVAGQSNNGVGVDGSTVTGGIAVRARTTNPGGELFSGVTSSVETFGVDSTGRVRIQNPSSATSCTAVLGCTNELFFQDNGQIRSLDDNHRIIFDRANNSLELREFGTIIFSPGATSGTRTQTASFNPDGSAQITGGLSVGGDVSFASSPRMFMTAFFPGQPIFIAGYFFVDRPFRVTRLSASSNGQAFNCTSDWQIVFGSNPGNNVIANQVVATFPEGSNIMDSGAISVSLGAGNYSFAVNGGTGCSQNIADVNASIEYVMQ